MNQHRNKEGNPSERWLQLGLLLVMLFVGHDVLMTRESMASPRVATEAVRLAVPSHATRDAHASSDDAAPEHEHPEQCGVGTTALPPGLATFPHVAQELPAGWCLDGAATPMPQRAALVWEEPHWPPDTLRALRQVYRI